MREAPPLASIGVVSAAAYRARRDAVRETYMKMAAPNGVVVRFIIARSVTHPLQQLADDGGGIGPEPEADILYVEQRGALARIVTPLLALYGWLQIATTNSPYNRSSFILKCDDDAYIFVPELALNLETILKSPQINEHPGPPTVAFGNTYWTSWHAANYIDVGTGYSSEMAARAGASCLSSGACTGPFPFSTGSLQGLSLALASAVASSSVAAANIAGLSTLSSSAASSRPRNTPVYEDAWVGYALVALLPRSIERRITYVMMDHQSFWDATGFSLHNHTLAVHWKANKGATTHRAKMRYAHWYINAYHCPSNVSLACGGRSKAGTWASKLPTLTRSDRLSCRNNCTLVGQPWLMCGATPNNASCLPFKPVSIPIMDAIDRFGK